MVLTKPDPAQAGARWYRERMLWNAAAAGRSIVLSLGGGMVAFETTTPLLRLAWKLLEDSGLEMPPTVVDRRRGTAVVLAEPDGAVLGQCQMPGGVRYLMAPSTIELPLVHVAAAAQDRSWVSSPKANDRCLPSASSVLAAFLAVVPPHLRADKPAAAARPRMLIG
ncbi:hypothetical protein UK23_45175 [Lentzea aerocolonigenes]|uniref:Uncharacterized protein n=1 Tax=Lentzea aerocolonigenes TaxID=68170 RepID=A0A0F0GC09_LENAE|nr:hypothetical protein [Lentzea aerocolonigenes]KJK33676.1 hypothetical protein UK23_45175 [Lentzea aerocolonigenes]